MIIFNLNKILKATLNSMWALEIITKEFDKLLRDEVGGIKVDKKGLLESQNKIVNLRCQTTKMYTLSGLSGRKLNLPLFLK